MTAWHPGLYVVATPIGNLADFSPRGQEALRRATLIAAEDTRVTGRLARMAGSSARLVSLTEHNLAERIPFVLSAAQEGIAVLATDAGTPAISDPGARLVAAAHAEGVPVWTVPGPSAAVAALSVAGFDVPVAVFAGFLPRQRGERQRRLRELAAADRAVVLFESPGRLPALLADIAAVLHDPEVVVCRELTKLHEEVVRGRASVVLQRFSTPRGECTVVIGPVAAARSTSGPTTDDLIAAFKRAGARRSAAAAEIARLTGEERERIYACWEGAGEPEPRG